MRPLIRKARRTQSPYKESEQNRQKPQRQEWNTESGMFKLKDGQGEDIEGQVSLDVESEPFCACPSGRKSFRLSICHSGNSQEDSDRMLEENHSGPESGPCLFLVG